MKTITAAGVLILLGVHAFGAEPTAATAIRAGAMRRPLSAAGIAAAEMKHDAVRNQTTLSVKPNAGTALKLFEPGGAEVSFARAADGTLRAQVDPKKIYTLAPPLAPSRQTLSKDGLEFPARYLSLVGGATQVGGLFLRPLALPLVWNERAGAYETQLVVGYEFGTGAESDLPTPRTVAFFADGANATIRENRVTITRSGVAGYKQVTLSTRQTEGETHFTARAGPQDEVKGSIGIAREIAGLALTMTSTEFAAFGVGSETLTVSLAARDGKPVEVAEKFEVLLTSRRLRLPAKITVEAGASSGTATVRSTGIGADTIVATAGGLTARLPVALVFPVATVMGALIGGAAGGAARHLRNRGKKGAPLGRLIVEGLLVGVIFVGAVWAGIIGLDKAMAVIGTPFGAFVLAALSGYLGCVVLDRVARKSVGRV